MKSVSVAVLSDLHFAGTEAGKSQTHVLLSESRPKNQDPIRDLFDLIDHEGLSADVVASPGDLTVASCEIGLKAAWSELQNVAGKLGATSVLAATGNHDIHSRDPEKAPEIWEALKQLTPSYPAPGASERQRLFYWAEHFTIVEHEWIRVVLLNSCNCHARGANEYEKGRVTEHTISVLRTELERLEEKPLNMLLCHHHPSALPELSDKQSDYSEMIHGAKLLSALEDISNNWIVVHGHKHLPTITYAKGGAVSPVIVSAGSFGAKLDSRYFATATNQFYILDFERDTIEASGCTGIVRAWDWINGSGWKRASSFDSQRPHRLIYGSGFGNRQNPIALAKQVDAVLGANRSMNWTSLLGKIPELAFMRLEDRVKLLKHLKDAHNLHPSSPDPISPDELVRKTP